MILEGNTRTNKKNYWKSSSASLVIVTLVFFLNNRFSWKRGGDVQITFIKDLTVNKNSCKNQTKKVIKLKFSGISLNNKRNQNIFWIKSETFIKNHYLRKGVSKSQQRLIPNFFNTKARCILVTLNVTKEYKRKRQDLKIIIFLGFFSIFLVHSKKI